MQLIAETLAKGAGHIYAPYVAALSLVAVYAFLGLDGTNFAISVVSLLLLFILQSSQTRDGLAIQIKLDALIDASEADNQLQRIDEKPADEVKAVRTDAGRR